MKICRLIAFVGVIAICVPLLAHAADESDITGWYLNKHRGVYTRIHVTSHGEEIALEINGGHVGHGPEAMIAGDCEVSAVGKVDGNKLTADFLPNQWDKKHRQISLTFGEGQLEVHGADLEGRCGVYTCFWGVYKKYSCEELKAVFHENLSHYREHPEDLENLCQ